MSHDARLARLEATFTAAVTPENRGVYCRACGGITIEDVMLAIDTQDRGGTYMTAEAAQAVCDALEAGEATYRRCGDVTLYGATLPMLAEERRRDALLCDGHLGTDLQAPHMQAPNTRVNSDPAAARRD